MIRITKIPLKVVDIFKKALNDTTITHLSQGSGVRLKRLMRGRYAKKKPDGGASTLSGLQKQL
ncbi:TPA: hypothetical protein MYR09_003585 [Citrobacter farmeri]|uniref:hypothetical protein n=1 Tax=Citrobacter farmeri TaxID=67824 RepID=UPI003733E0D8|nr:hypothetical protein [Citrobacter farmeri]